MAEANLAVLAVGSCFHGRYEVVRCVKAGGMGAVYEVVDQKTRRRRALKVMLPSSIQDADLRARFKLEATITSDVESDHIVETFDADIDAATGSPFLVMEYLKGDDLSALIEKRRRLPPDEVLHLLGQAARALDKTHAAGIVHRDLKPENLFVVRADDGTPRLKILDFGIAKLVAQSAAVHTTRVMGTPLYMPKEQIVGDGSIGAPADLYALGHIAFTLLVGEAYWTEEGRSAPAQYVFLSTVMQGATEPAVARAARKGVALPTAFDAWFAKATALDAGYRFDRATTMVAALAEALAGPAATFAPAAREPVEHRLAVSAPGSLTGPVPEVARADATRVSAPDVAAASALVAGSHGSSTVAAVSSDRRTPPTRSRARQVVGGVAVVLAVGAAGLATRFGAQWTTTEPARAVAPTRDAERTNAAAPAPTPTPQAPSGAADSETVGEEPPTPPSVGPTAATSVARAQTAPPQPPVSALAKARPTKPTPSAATVKRPADDRDDDPTHTR